ncbi:DUF2304 domain-containing protein [Actinomyces minihominis]|uniref:DUF2304 domain-containing protein n=1 Tax=Actinomyces minihominis TaxID=2002838 RepID=UPI000C07C558|nr:DUF2304 domain-containing protein [Actinomyces minihominis]
MSSYWLIKALLILSLIIITYILVRPSRSANSLAIRRIGIFLILAGAVFAILFPGIFNSFARTIGVTNGTNLLVYLLVIALFAQMATSYRRDAQLNEKLTTLAREVALARRDDEQSG